MRPVFIQSTITGIAVGIALIHAYFPTITIDGVTVTLLAVAAIPWLAPLFQSLELPGGIKVHFKELEDVKKKAEVAGLISTAQIQGGASRHVYAFEAVAGNDPNLALAGLRIEIETRLRELAQRKKLSNATKSIRQLTEDLVAVGVLGSEEVSAINDLLPLLNRAVHGATVDERASQWALDFGPKILLALEERLGESSIPRLLERWRVRDGAAGAEVGTELSKSFVQSPKAFLLAMQNDPISFDDWLKGLGQHTFTLYKSRSELDDDLYGAYHEKLKQLMVEAAKGLLNSDFKQEAQRLLDALSGITVQRIW